MVVVTNGLWDQRILEFHGKKRPVTDGHKHWFFSGRSQCLLLTYRK